MRKILALLPAAALAATLFAPASQAAATPLTPRPAGEFVIHMPDGSQKLLSSYRNKLVVMAFMFTTCEHCQHTAGLLAKIQTEYAPKGVQVLGVTIDAGAKDRIPAFLKITGANFPVGYSDQPPVFTFLHMNPDGWYVPMLVFIDHGTVRSQYIVYDPGDAASKFLDAQDGDPKTGDRGTIRKEIDKYLRPAARRAPAKKAPAKM